MLDKKQIRYMSRLAMYDKKLVEKDLRIVKFYRKDYAAFNTLVTIIELTFGYIVIIGVYAVYNMDKILGNLTMEKMAVPLFIAVCGYFILIATYGVLVYNFYKKRHIEAKKRLKKYYRRLSHLEEMRMNGKG